MRPLILFDFDGVIADSLSTFEGILRESFSRMGHNIIRSREDFLDLFNDNLYASFRKHGISDQEVKKNFDYVGKKVHFEAIPIYNDVPKMLLDLNDMATVAIVSSNKEEQILRTLRGNKIDHLFKKVLGYESGLSKVDKLRLAVRLFGSDPSETLYVVDTIGDLAEAKEAGVRSVAVGWGWHSVEKLLSQRPDMVAESPASLTRTVRELCQNLA